MLPFIPDLSSLAFNVLNVVVPLVGAVVLLTRVKGPGRNVGVVGCLVLVVTGVVQTIFFLIVRQLANRSGGIAIYNALNLVSSVLSLVGLALIVAAACMGRAAPGPQFGYGPAPSPYAPGGGPMGPSPSGPTPR